MKITNFSTDLNSQKQIREQAMMPAGDMVQTQEANETVRVETQEETQEKPQKGRKAKRVSTEKV